VSRAARRAAPLVARDVTVSFGGRAILDGVDVTLPPRRRVGLIGPNGVGKSTLLRTLAGLLVPDLGRVERTPPSATVGLLHQELTTAATRGDTVDTVLRERTGVAEASAALETATHALAEHADGSDDRYADALEHWMVLGAADFDSRIDQALAEVGLPPGCLHQSVATLSGGQAGRVGLAALLLSRYDMYLLDEPTNDLDLTGLDLLERWVTGLDAAVMVVSHDRRFLARVVTDVVELDEFTKTSTHFAGGWQAYLDERERARRHAWERFEQYDTERKGLLQRGQRQREWADRGLAAVRRSDERDKFIRFGRIAQTEKLAAKAARTEKAIERLEKIEKPREPWQLRLSVDSPGRSGDIVAALDEIVVERGDFRLGPVSLEIGFGERVVLAGLNGSGKSTLVDAVLGRAEPVSGSVYVGPSVVVGEITQARRQLDSERPLLRVFIDRTGHTVSEARTLLAKFRLVGDHVERAAASLSPGERTRAALALLMANGANWLVLDEPTNHLDLPAIEQLESALSTFDGSVLLVSHDRALLEQVDATRIIELAHGSIVRDEPVGH
jgi:ATPase subunit of ABC transporter with duplicated ATPase domains